MNNIYLYIWIMNKWWINDEYMTNHDQSIYYYQLEFQIQIFSDWWDLRHFFHVTSFDGVFHRLKKRNPQGLNDLEKRYPISQQSDDKKQEMLWSLELRHNCNAFAIGLSLGTGHAIWLGPLVPPWPQKSERPGANGHHLSYWLFHIGSHKCISGSLMIIPVKVKV